ncbi:MAG: hypothetical protein CME72_12310 [Halomonadaceae bacterium]|nr:hypothetical protein [Halomonadaceae bacterium]
MAGLLGAALAGAVGGGGKAVQWNAQSQIEQKRAEALKAIDNDYATDRADTKWQREKSLAAAQATQEERHRQEDRQWEVQDARLSHQRDIALQQIKDQGGSGRSAPSRIREADMLVERGVYDSFDEAYSHVRSRAGQNNERAIAEQKVEGLRQRVSDLKSAIDGESRLLTEDEMQRAQANLKHYSEQLRQAENSLYEFVPPSVGEPSPEPEPSPSLSRGSREQGRRPGPEQSQQPQAQVGAPTADDILHKHY